MSVDALIPQVNRPQYIQSPDLFLIALANRAEAVGPYEPPQPENPARIFHDRRDGNGYVETAPDGLSLSVAERRERMERWSDAVTRAGIVGDAIDPQVVGTALSLSMRRHAGEKAKSISAVPFSAHTALLQDARGLVGLRAPDYALIVEQLFSLGGEASESARSSATQLWSDAMSRRSHVDDLASAIDRAVVELLPAVAARGIPIAPDPTAATPLLGNRIRSSRGTPMHWLVRSWKTVTSEAWVDRLPARRWTDWASAVLRLGVGMSFVWEAHYFNSLAAIILSGAEPTADDLDRAIGARGNLIRWGDSQLAVSSRAVRLRPELQRGLRAATWFRSHIDPAIGADPLEALSQLSADEQARADLTAHLGPDADPPGFNNLLEAVRYALSGRETDGDGSDLYGLLRYRGRYLVVEPGPELLAVIVSLLTDVGGRTTVGDVLESLALLGIRVSLSELLAEVERAGVAEVAADADLAVTVRSAF